MLHINVIQLCMHVIPILGLFNKEASLFGIGSLKNKGGASLILPFYARTDKAANTVAAVVSQ